MAWSRFGMPGSFAVMRVAAGQNSQNLTLAGALQHMGQLQLGDQLGEQSGGSQSTEEQKRGQHGRPNRWLSLIGHPLDLHLILRN